MIEKYMLRDYMRKPGSKEKNIKGNCRFCEIVNKKEDMVFETEKVFVMINQYPYKEGHILVLPKKHIKDPREMDKETLMEFFKTINFMLDILGEAYDTKSFNIGCNLGSAASATYEHLHFQIVPRWEGDTGFMEIFASTRVMKEHPKKTRDKLKEIIRSKSRSE
ncbi:MAG: HIT domain-containing protein [Candidatus Aenigmatarchaeota archaeon]